MSVDERTEIKVLKNVIVHHLNFFSESNMGQESDSRTNYEIEEHDLNDLSDSESLSQDDDQEEDQEKFQVNDMDYYSGEDPDDWDSFIKEHSKTSQNHPEKAKYSEINDTIVIDDDDIEESEVPGFKCNLCSSFWTSIQDMNNHIKSDHADENSENVGEESDENDEIEILSQFSCKLCSEDFDTAEDIDDHLSKFHSILDELYRKDVVTKSKKQ